MQDVIPQARIDCATLLCCDASNRPTSNFGSLARYALQWPWNSRWPSQISRHPKQVRVSTFRLIALREKFQVGSNERHIFLFSTSDFHLFAINDPKIQDRCPRIIEHLAWQASVLSFQLQVIALKLSKLSSRNHIDLCAFCDLEIQGYSSKINWHSNGPWGSYVPSFKW